MLLSIFSIFISKAHTVDLLMEWEWPFVVKKHFEELLSLKMLFLTTKIKFKQQKSAFLMTKTAF